MLLNDLILVIVDTKTAPAVLNLVVLIYWFVFSVNNRTLKIISTILDCFKMRKLVGHKCIGKFRKVLRIPIVIQDREEWLKKLSQCFFM